MVDCIFPIFLVIGFLVFLFGIVPKLIGPAPFIRYPNTPMERRNYRYRDDVNDRIDDFLKEMEKKRAERRRKTIYSSRPVRSDEYRELRKRIEKEFENWSDLV